MKKIVINTDFITLGQFLKFTDIISSGAMAKAYLETNKVIVNDEIENRRGRKLYPNYTVVIGNDKFLIVGK